MKFQWWSEAYLEPRQASVMELFCEYTERCTILQLKLHHRCSTRLYTYDSKKILTFSKRNKGRANHRDCFNA